MNKYRRKICLASAAALAFTHFPTSLAQAYPTRPIKIIVPSSAGGVVDVEVRRIAPYLSKVLGQPVVIENRPGASQTIGAALVAKASADGYILLRAGTASLATAPAMMPNLSYDPLKDFEPITQFGRSSPVLLVNRQLGVRNFQELVKLAKKKPGQLNYASNGAAGSLHVMGELLKVAAGVDLVHIPYKGTAPMLSALLANEAQMGFDFAATSASYVKAGRLKALFVSGWKRIPLLPDVPTAAEAGYPQLELMVTGGYLAPAGTPREIVARLNNEITKIMRLPAISDWLEKSGIEAVGSSPNEYRAAIADELVKWRRIVKMTGVTME